MLKKFDCTSSRWG